MWSLVNFNISVMVEIDCLEYRDSPKHFTYFEYREEYSGDVAISPRQGNTDRNN